MKNYYDIAIIGGGIGGLMAAYRITERDPSASVCIIEKGHTIEKRSCPIVTKKVDKCIKCPSCAIMEGLAGAGAFSDGKYVISTEYGGWLTDFLKPQTVIDRNFPDAGGHTVKSRGKVSSDTGEECAGLLHAFLLRRNGDVLFLNEIVALRRLA